MAESGRMMFWGGSFTEELELFNARRAGASSTIDTSGRSSNQRPDAAKPKVEFKFRVLAGLPLRSK